MSFGHDAYAENPFAVAGGLINVSLSRSAYDDLAFGTAPSGSYNDLFTGNVGSTPATTDPGAPTAFSAVTTTGGACTRDETYKVGSTRALKFVPSSSGKISVRFGLASTHLAVAHAYFHCDADVASGSSHPVEMITFYAGAQAQASVGVVGTGGHPNFAVFRDNPAPTFLSTGFSPILGNTYRIEFWLDTSTLDASTSNVGYNIYTVSGDAETLYDTSTLNGAFIDVTAITGVEFGSVLNDGITPGTFWLGALAAKTGQITDIGRHVDPVSASATANIGRFKTASDNATVSDAAVGVISGHFRTTSDSVPVSDAVDRVVALSRSSGGTVARGESLTNTVRDAFNDAAAGTNVTTTDAGDTFPVSGLVGSAGTLTRSTTPGGLPMWMLVHNTSAADLYAYWNLETPTAKATVHCYYYQTGSNGTTTRVLSVGTATPTQVAAIAVSNRTILLINNAGATLFTSAGTLADSTIYRFELQVDNSGGASAVNITLNVYQGLTSTTPVANLSTVLTGVASSAGSMARVWAGRASGGAAAGDFYIGDVAGSITLAEIGPYGGQPTMVAITDSVARAVVLPRGTSDSATVSEAVARALALPRATSDNATVTEAPTTAPQSFTRTASDTIGTSCAATRAVADSRTGSDTIGVSEVVARALALPRATADSVPVSEVVTRTLTFTRATADTIGTSCVATCSVAESRSVSDNGTISEAVTRALAYSRTASETATVSEVVARSILLPRAPTDSAVLSDAATRTLAFSRSTSDTIGVSDAASGSVTSAAGAQSRSATDTIGVSDAASAHVTLARSTADSAVVSDAATRAAQTFLRTAADSAAIVDGAAPAVALHASAADTITFSDAGVAVVHRFRSASDSIPFSDAASRLLALRGAAADSVAVTDIAACRVFLHVSGSDSAGISDLARANVLLLRTAVDTLGIDDAADGAFIPHPIDVEAFDPEVVVVSPTCGLTLVSPLSAIELVSGSAAMDSAGDSTGVALASPTAGVDVVAEDMTL